MATAVPRASLSSRYEALTAEDFETASIRSAAPSYISEAPSYHSTAIPNEPAPPYTPRESSSTPTPSNRRQNPATLLPSRTSGPAFIPGSSGLALTSTAAPSSTVANRASPSTSGGASGLTTSPRVTTGLPPVPSAPLPPPGAMPSISSFRIPTIYANPNARHYVRVAQRRAQAAAAATDANIAMRMLIDRVEEEEQRRFRPLEDPYLVGEEEARRARERRIAREAGALSEADGGREREGRRWDWFLGQVREWDERDRRSPLGAGGAAGSGLGRMANAHGGKRNRGLGRGLFGRR